MLNRLMVPFIPTKGKQKITERFETGNVGIEMG
jgi:hypothetical protein